MGDPMQLLRLHGMACNIVSDSARHAMVEAESSLMPCLGQQVCARLML